MFTLKSALMNCNNLFNKSLSLFLKIDGMSSMVSSNVTDSGMSESSEPPNTLLSDSITSTNNHLSLQQLTGTGIQTQQSSLSTANSGMEQGHSRNSSNTSQVSDFTQLLLVRLFHFMQQFYMRLFLSLVDVQRIWL